MGGFLLNDPTVNYVPQSKLRTALLWQGRFLQLAGF
jgi:hypothetical protein